MEILIITIDTAGTLLIAWAALRVHHRFLNEHRVDEKVLSTMKIEQRFGILGMTLVIIGYILTVIYLI
ncbi:MAG: hypothetical protein MRY49_01535 [Candidatus Pacebacteria bacterium]|nr:hypothetical protein [Candidatus Paceibacterota bacterium]